MTIRQLLQRSGRTLTSDKDVISKTNHIQRITILQNQRDLPQLAAAGTWDHPWAVDYHNWFRSHEDQIATDATPTQLGFTDRYEEIAIPLAGPLPIYQAEYLAAALATQIVPPGFTIRLDTLAVMYNIHKGRCPPGWLRWLSHLFRDRACSYRYIPSAMNPADAPSRWIMR